MKCKQKQIELSEGPGQCYYAGHKAYAKREFGGVILKASKTHVLKRKQFFRSRISNLKSRILVSALSKEM
jgi:hypothetical protein